MHPPRTFSGSRLRSARLAAGIDKPESLAFQIQKSVYTVLKYERDIINPPIDVVAQLADVLHVSIDELLTDRVAADVA